VALITKSSTQGGDTVFTLNGDNIHLKLIQSSHDIAYIYGKNDSIACFGGNEKTIYDFGAGAPGTILQSDGHGDTMLGNIDSVGATVEVLQVNFLFANNLFIGNTFDSAIIGNTFGSANGGNGGPGGTDANGGAGGNGGFNDFFSGNTFSTPNVTTAPPSGG
jgi:hypothetical protein